MIEMEHFIIAATDLIKDIKKRLWPFSGYKIKGDRVQRIFVLIENLYESSIKKQFEKDIREGR